MHDNGLIHGDLTTSNFMLQGPDQALVRPTAPAVACGMISHAWTCPLQLAHRPSSRLGSIQHGWVLLAFGRWSRTLFLLLWEKIACQLCRLQLSCPGSGLCLNRPLKDPATPVHPPTTALTAIVYMFGSQQKDGMN